MSHWYHCKTVFGYHHSIHVFPIFCWGPWNVNALFSLKIPRIFVVQAYPLAPPRCGVLCLASHRNPVQAPRSTKWFENSGVAGLRGKHRRFVTEILLGSSFHLQDCQFLGTNSGNILYFFIIHSVLKLWQLFVCSLICCHIQGVWMHQQSSLRTIVKTVNWC